MIDLRLLRDNPDLVKASQRARGESESMVDDLLRADEERRAAVQRFEALRAEQKQLSARIPKATGEEKTALLARTKELSAEVKAAESASTEADQRLRHLKARTTLTANLKPLERRGLVRIKVDEADRRSRRLALTADGRALLAEAAPIWKRSHAMLERQLKRGGDALRRDLAALS